MFILGVHNDANHSNLDGKPQATLQGIRQQQLAESLPLMAPFNGQASKACNGKRKVGESVQVPGRQVLLSDSRHGHAVEAANSQSLHGNVGAAYIGIGMLASKPPKIFIQCFNAA